MDHAIERPLGLPQLFDAQCEDLRVVRHHVLPLTPRLRKQPAGPLGERRDLCEEIIRRRAPGRGLPVAIETRGRGPHTGNSGVTHEQLCRRKSGEHVDTDLFGLGAEPADDLTQRRDVEGAIVHRRRRGQPQLTALGEEIDRLFRHRSAEWKVPVRQVREEIAKCTWVDDRT